MLAFYIYIYIYKAEAYKYVLQLNLFIFYLLLIHLSTPCNGRDFTLLAHFTSHQTCQVSAFLFDLKVYYQCSFSKYLNLAKNV